jgi:hypothetical protein
LRPYHALEFWRHGQKLSLRAGLEALTRIVPREVITQALINAVHIKISTEHEGRG